jgi:hypothetical protein
MKTEQAIIEERERSARKRAEIDAEVNDNREIVYNYVASRKDVIGKTCVEELKMFEKGKRYLEWLSLNGHLSRMLRQVSKGKKMYVYNAIMPYVKPVIVEAPQVPKETKKQKDAQTIINGVTRVINLLDREQTPRTKEERERTNSGRMSGMQSSMNMFGSW